MTSSTDVTLKKKRKKLKTQYNRKNSDFGIWEIWVKMIIFGRNIYKLISIISSSLYYFSSVQFSCSVMSDSLQPHGLQHNRLPCPSPTTRACSNSCPLSWWCHPTISSSVVPFSSCLQSFPASGSFSRKSYCLSLLI